MFLSKNSRTPDPQGLDWANQLYRAVNKVKPVPYKNVKGWAEYLARLGREQTPEKVQQVLDWYCEHLHEDYCPKAYTGETFRRKFSQIHKYMTTADSTTVGDYARQAAERALTYHNYPAEIAAVLPQIAEQSSQNWLDFLNHICHYMAANRGDRSWAFLNRVHLMNGATFVEEWLAFLGRRFSHYSSYDGPTGNLYFRPRSTLFRDHFWHRWSMEWCSVTTQFDHLLEVLASGEVSKASDL